MHLCIFYLEEFLDLRALKHFEMVPRYDMSSNNIEAWLLEDC